MWRYKSLISVRTKGIMDRNVVLVESHDKVSETIQRMLDKGVWSVVMTEGGLPVGAVTGRDVLRQCISKSWTPNWSRSNRSWLPPS